MQVPSFLTMFIMGFFISRNNYNNIPICLHNIYNETLKWILMIPSLNIPLLNFIHKTHWASVDFDYDAPPNSLMDSIVSPKGDNSGRIKSWGTSPGSQHFGDRRVCWRSETMTRKSEKQINYSYTWTNQTISWLVCSWNTFGAQDSPQPELGGSHPHYSILCTWP